MPRSLLIRTGFIGLLSMIIGVLFKIQHYANADTFILTGLFLFGMFWVATIWEIVNKQFKQHSQNFFWLMLVLIMPGIASFVYHFKQKNEDKNFDI